jgi:tripartite ATP-independent transporter DctM subunit
MFPALVDSGYPKRFSVGILATAGSLGCMIPPAISMLIYAISVQGSAAVDPSDLFFAGLVPALFIAGLLAVYSIGVGLRVPGSKEPFDAGRLWAAAKGAGWALTLPCIVLGGIYGGLFTPTEAGAVAFAAAVVVSVFVHQDVTLGDLPAILAEAATLIGSLILIVVLAFGLNDFLAEIDAPGMLDLFIEPNDGSVVENADNVTVAPWGDLELCEDEAGPGDDANRIVGVTPGGQLYHFARNAGSSSELAGACFSPDGSTLFLNVQTDGLTLAINGPWRT